MRHALIHRQYKRSTKARMKSWDDAFRNFMQGVFDEMRSVVAGFVVVVSQETKKGVCFVGFVYVDKESESKKKREEREDN